MTSCADTFAMTAPAGLQPARRRIRRALHGRAPSHLHALRTDSRAQEVVRLLTRRILDGELKQGELLPPERDLALQLGVSRTVVREATKSLQSDGLVAIRHGVGTVVTGASSEPVTRAFNQALHDEIDALAKLYEVRVAIETATASLAAERATPESIEKLHNLCLEMDVSVGDDPEQQQRFIELDMAFHGAIAAATENNAFVIVLEAATARLIAERKKPKYTDYTSRSNREAQLGHRQIFEAIKAGDATLAVSLVQGHLKPPQSPKSERRKRS
jgi:GntR family transcriptional repressor for pyruvate dehydrogenase complex